MTYYSNELRDAGFTAKSAEVAEATIFMADMWKTDVWNLMVFNAAPVWMANSEYAQRGILFINEYENKGGLRSDVYWLRGCLNKMTNNIDGAIKDWRRALQGDGDMNSLELYSCLPIYNTILPAIELYVVTPDDGEKQYCLNILSNYKDVDVVKKFYKDFNIK